MRKDELKLKITLIIVSIIIVAIIVVNNFLGGSGKIQNDNKTNIVQGERIEKAEVMRYFAFLFYHRSELQELSYSIPEHLLSKDTPSSEYANALYSLGIIRAKDLSFYELDKNITCGEYRDLLWATVDYLKLNYRDLSAYLPQRLTRVEEEDELLKEEFFVMYEAIMDGVNQLQEDRFLTKNLYFLGSKENSNQAMVDHPLEMWITQEQNPFYVDNRYLDVKQDDYLKVVVCDDEILLVQEKLVEKVVLSNVYMLHGSDKTVTAFINSMQREFTTSLRLAEGFERVVGDITIEDGVISGITIKPDIIRGKVLVTGQEEIEVEGYGIIPLHEEYRIYKVYDDISMERTNSILVGYQVTDFVVSDGKICAALIQEKIKAKNIRVLLNTTGFASVYHETMTFTSDTDFIIDDGVNATTFPAGEEVTVGAGSKLLERGRIKISSTKEEGKIELLKLNRSYGIPRYRGSIEIALTKEGLIIVNELSIEEYLYSVVPSEMPTSYGPEALKVQAVCARSYAFKQLMANKFSNYGAHVDDSVNCQVYNNIEENEASILAVKDTYGQVITKGGNVLTAYYFSTSSGHTASVEDVWEDSAKEEYLTGKLQVDSNVEVDFSNEAAFRKFILADSVEVLKNSSAITEVIDTYDSGFLMYRWNVTFPVDVLSKQINSFLEKRYTESTKSILTYVGKITDEDLKAMDLKQQYVVNDNLIFANQPIKSIGTVQDIKVMKRGDSGIIKELMIIGSKKTILVFYQTNVRTLLAPKDAPLVRLDGSTMSGMTLLPSAFCVIDPVVKEGDTIAFEIHGGGFGHGVGMSQNGVKAMTQQNKSYDQILAHYYNNSELSLIYD